MSVSAQQEPKQQRLASDVGPFAMVPMWLLLSGVTSRAIHLFGVLAAKYADREQTAYPGRALLASDLDCSTDSVDRAMQELIGAGAIKVTRRQLESGDYTTNHYQLFFADPKGSRTVAPTPPGRTDAERVAAPVPPPSRTGAETGTIPTDPEDLSPARARQDKPRQGSVIPRGGGGSVKWHQQMERQHANCHPEICKWRDSKIRECMPMALVSRYAQKLPGLSDDDAIADVIAWARGDAPPADYVAPGDVYEHWQLRWDLTRATASAGRVKAAATERSTVPSAADTDALIREITGGRTS